MKKFLIWTLGILAVLALLFFFVLGPIMRSQTKKHSPEQTVTFTQNNQDIRVFYCSPSKKGREIFGALVPYNEVWRTGANEATTFETKNDLTVSGQQLPAGKYTIWTIPGKDTWEVIFNSKMYSWGVSLQGGSFKSSHDPKADVLKITVPVGKVSTIEQFTIAFEQTPQQMTLAWDSTKISIPFQ